MRILIEIKHGFGGPPGGKLPFALDIEPSETIEDVKKKICAKEPSVLPEKQQLVCTGVTLENAKKVSDYDVLKEGVKVHVVPVPKAGKK